MLFTPAFYERGGIARRSRLLGAGLAAQGWHVSVITRGNCRWFRVSRAPNLVVIEVPGYPLRRTGTLLYLAVAFPLGVVMARRATVLAAIKLFSTSSAAALCGLVARRPFVAMATTSGVEGEVAELCAGDGVGLRVRRALLRRAAVLVAQTPAGAEELARIVPAGRTAVLPTPVEIVDPPDLTGTPKVLYAGRLSQDKGLVTLLEGWRGVVDRRGDATLALAGEGGFHQSVEAELRRMVESDPALLRSVHFTGWLADVSPLLAECDVFVLPSLNLQEGMSNALVEACAWGRVVVASDIPGNRAVLGDDYPLFVPPGDPSELASAIGRALDDDPVRENARLKVLARARLFSVGAVGARFGELLYAAQGGVTTPAPG